MTRQTGIQVEGLSRLVRQLQGAGVEIGELKDVFGAIADMAAESARGFAPRRSGALAASIRGNRAKGSATVTAGGARLKYVAPINYGWPKRNIRASEFMQKADEYMKTRSVAMMEDGIETLLRERGLA